MEIERLIAPLDDRGRYILTHRFGLGEHPPRSLRRIAADLAISAERVRQIEQALLAGLANRLPPGERDALIAASTDRVWRHISGTEPFLRRRDLHRRGASMPRDFGLLLAIAGLSVTDWLERACQPIGEGWVSRDISASRIADVARQIEQRLAHRRTAAIAHIGEGLEIDEIRIAAALVLDLPIRNGRIGWTRSGQCRRFTATSSPATRYR